MFALYIIFFLKCGFCCPKNDDEQTNRKDATILETLAFLHKTVPFDHFKINHFWRIRCHSDSNNTRTKSNYSTRKMYSTRIECNRLGFHHNLHVENKQKDLPSIIPPKIKFKIKLQFLLG